MTTLTIIPGTSTTPTQSSPVERRSANNTTEKVSKLSKIIAEIKCFFKHEKTPIAFSAVTGAALIALSLAYPPASIAAIACYVLAGLIFATPFATHKVEHQPRLSEEGQTIDPDIMSLGKIDKDEQT